MKSNFAAFDQADSPSRPSHVIGVQPVATATAAHEGTLERDFVAERTPYAIVMIPVDDKLASKAGAR